MCLYIFIYVFLDENFFPGIYKILTEEVYVIVNFNFWI